ncbi:hypothetical protein LRS11_07420 [Pseudomonas sp. J452]|uniref:beta strand repeat-containing protein n=1 Tax=Pseudomonas sp. J452 TaxID=2898441 RepID=UPI0021ADF426|nr:hypothetical protein [Pseudomonas sp. J452]UUY09855.1 hypothetical protein LRS11_07420 [Pseudomonas sp. J452]
MAVINGTSGSETLNGTADNDSLAGDSGNDILLGGSGLDTATYSGNSYDYRFGWSSGHLTITDTNITDGDEGADSLFDIEQLQFADRTFEVTPGGISQINTTTNNSQYAPAVTTLSDGGWVVTWTGTGAGDGQGIFCQRYDKFGNPVGGETAVNSTTEQHQAMPSVAAMSDGGWLVAWTGNGANDSHGIFTQRYDATGTPMGTETQVISSTEDEIYPSVTGLSDGGWVASWESNGQLFSQRYDADNNPTGSEVLVSQTCRQHSSSTTALSDGGWVVSWYEVDAQANYIGRTVLQRYDADGEPAGERLSFGNFAYDTHPSVTTLEDGGWLVAWRGYDAIYVSRYDASNASTGPITQIPTSGGNVSAIGLADGGWLITSSTYDTWSEYDYSETISTRFDASGQQVAVISSGDKSDLQTTPAVTIPLPDGGWLVTWEAVDDDYTGIFSQRYDAEGVAQLYEIHGTDQNDVLSGQSPLALSGGAGDDIYIIETAAAAIRENSGEGIDTVYSYLSSYTLAKNIENGRILAAGPAAITGNELNNVLYAGTGESGYGYVLNGGTGIDTASFAYSKIAVTAQINFPANVINPAYNSLNDIENLTGSDFNDNLAGDLANNVINGGLGADKMIGGDGSDTYYVDNVGDVVTETNGGASGGTDIVYSYLASHTLGNSIENGRILASDSANLTGNSLNNVLYAGSGNNILNGGSGIDTASYLYAASAITASLASTSAQATGGSGSDTFSAIENLTGSNYNDKLTGNSSGNILNGGAGADTLIGGDGSDTYYVDSVSDVVSETNASASTGGTDLVYSYLTSYTLGNNIENGRILASGSANLTGNSLNNVLYAGSGNNILNGGSGIDTVSYLYAASSITASLASTSAQATGGSGSDTFTAIENLTGSNYNDKLTGNTMSNILDGGEGTDTMIGGDGSDTYYVDSASDVVSETNATASTGGTDTVHSYLTSYTLGNNIENGRILASGSANLTGNSLNNVLYAGSGNNILNGGNGADSVSYLYASSAITASLASTSAQATGGSGSDTFSAIENLTGSNYNDKLTGNSSGNILNGGAGADTLIGGDGSDTYYVDSVSDVVSETNASASTGGTDLVYSYLTSYTLGNNIENGRILASGSANLTGNSLNNVLYAGSGNNILNGGNGADTASYLYASSAITASLASTSAQTTGGSGSDTLTAIENLTGSSYKDTLTGNTANNTLNGGLGNDILNGGAGADTLIGGDGSDAYYVDSASDVVSETNATVSTGGIDFVHSYLTSYTLGNNIENGRILASGSSNLTGNSLNNVLYAGSGNNILNGGNGADTASYLYASSAITASLASTSAQTTGGSGSDTLTAIENLTGSNYNDTLTGNTADNTLNGGLGNDILNGGAGADTMIGGDGSDTYYVDNASDVVSETNATVSTGGTDSVYSYLTGYTLGNNIENGRILASGSANLTGNSLNNVLYAGSGNNILNGGSGIDTASYLYAASAITASLASTSAQTTGGSGSDTLTAIENLTGSNYNDKLTGNSSGNILNGGVGADTMIGGDGADIYYVDNDFDVVTETSVNGGIDTVYSHLFTIYTLASYVENGRLLHSEGSLNGNSLDNILYASTGDNWLHGNGGSDTVSYLYASSAITVNLDYSSPQATGGSGSDTLQDIENVTGSDYNDKLSGNFFSNRLEGGTGNDTLNGAGGSDVLIGGAGNDAFAFSSLSEMGLTSDTWDSISDFVRGADMIDLSKLDANTAASGDNAFNTIIDGAAAFTAAGQLKVSNGVLYGNTDADSTAEFAIQLIGVSSISLADFIA